MLLDLWFHHHLRNEPGNMHFSSRRINRQRENDEALLMMLGQL